MVRIGRMQPEDSAPIARRPPTLYGRCYSVVMKREEEYRRRDPNSVQAVSDQEVIDLLEALPLRGHGDQEWRWAVCVVAQDGRPGNTWTPFVGTDGEAAHEARRLADSSSGAVLFCLDTRKVIYVSR